MIDWSSVRGEAVRPPQALLPLDTANPPGHEIAAARYLEGVPREEGVGEGLVDLGVERSEVIYAGGDRLFAAGADIGEFGGPDEARAVGGAFVRALDAVAAIPRCVVAAVSGVALGGGFIYAADDGAIDGARVTRGSRAEFLADLKHDVRFALRSLRRAPAFAGSAIATIAVAVAVLLLVVARSLRKLFDVTWHLLNRRLPRRLSLLLGGLVVLVHRQLRGGISEVTALGLMMSVIVAMVVCGRAILLHEELRRRHPGAKYAAGGHGRAVDGQASERAPQLVER